VSVAAQHFPILVPGDERDLFNGKPSLEKAARAFVTQIVKMKVIDLQFPTLKLGKTKSDALETEFKRKGARYLVFSHPNNPTGAVFLACARRSMATRVSG
jgi:aspartate/methionine/tyrosine aminotransferase